MTSFLKRRNQNYLNWDKILNLSHWCFVMDQIKRNIRRFCKFWLKKSKICTVTINCRPDDFFSRERNITYSSLANFIDVNDYSMLFGFGGCGWPLSDTYTHLQGWYRCNLSYSSPSEGFPHLNWWLWASRLLLVLLC